MLPTSPSLIIRLLAAYLTGYMQSTISHICVISRFFIKSLSNMADLIISRDLERKSIKIKSNKVKACYFIFNS